MCGDKTTNNLNKYIIHKHATWKDITHPGQQSIIVYFISWYWQYQLPGWPEFRLKRLLEPVTQWWHFTDTLVHEPVCTTRKSTKRIFTEFFWYLLLPFLPELTFGVDNPTFGVDNPRIKRRIRLKRYQKNWVSGQILYQKPRYGLTTLWCIPRSCPTEGLGNTTLKDLFFCFSSKCFTGTNLARQLGHQDSLKWKVARLECSVSDPTV